MPCDSTIQNTVELGQVPADVLESALKAMGADVRGRGFYLNGDWYSIGNGVLASRDVTAETLAETCNQVKRAVSGEAIKRAAIKFGWKQKGQGTATKFTLAKQRVGGR